MRYWLILLLLLLAACDNAANESDDSPAATSDATRTPIPTSSTILPPTWTATPEGFVATQRPTQQVSTNTPLAVREGTLPPTWTPFPTSTPHPPLPTRIPPTIFVAEGTAAPVSRLCREFEPHVGQNTGSEYIYQESNVGIFWMPITSEEGYTFRFRVIHPDGTVILEEETASTEFEIPSGLLNAGNQVYSWEVQPIKDGELVCFPVTGEIFVEFFEE